MTRLLVVSHTPHYRRDHTIVGWGATVRELDYLATLFDEVVHVAPLYDEAAPRSALPYASANVRLRQVRPAGGESLRDKLRIIGSAASYSAAIWEELNRADVVHVRCPANISLLAVLLLALRRKPEKRWIKYAGDWGPVSNDPISYRFQRWWLKGGWHRGTVTVNGSWPGQPEFVRSFLNPCLTETEIEGGRIQGRSKRLSVPMRLLFVGVVDELKGMNTALEVVRRARNHIGVVLDVVGDGPDRTRFETRAGTLGLSDAVRFHGWKPRPELAAFYGEAHVLLFPSLSEGWPKVLSEGMASGVVPVASRVGSVEEYLRNFKTGVSLDANDTDGFVRALVAYAADPEKWKQESLNGLAAAPSFGYDSYVDAVRNLLDLESRRPEPKSLAEVMD